MRMPLSKLNFRLGDRQAIGRDVGVLVAASVGVGVAVVVGVFELGNVLVAVGVFVELGVAVAVGGTGVAGTRMVTERTRSLNVSAM